MKNILVFYHKNCSDGFGAAWSAWQKFKDKADYIGIEAGADKSMKAIKGIKNKEAYLLDFCWTKKVMKEFLKNNKKVTAIDHHISRREAIELAPFHSYSTNHSGSVLTWKYLHPGKPIPKLLLHIEDFDLWRFKIPFTKEISAVLKISDFDFKKWSKMAKELENSKSRKKYIEYGKAITGYQEKIVKTLVKGGEKVKLNGHRAMVVNSPTLKDEIADLIIKKLGFPLVIVWSNHDGRIQVSLRSNEKVDVSKLAAKYGGGGHKKAAGLSLSRNQAFPWKPVK